MTVVFVVFVPICLIAFASTDNPRRPLTDSARSFRLLTEPTRSVSKKKYVERSLGRIELITSSPARDGCYRSSSYTLETE